jgi:hypothetical protein
MRKNFRSEEHLDWDIFERNRDPKIRPGKGREIWCGEEPMARIIDGMRQFTENV